MISSTKLGTILIILAAISYLTVGNYTQTLPWVGDLAPIALALVFGGALYFALFCMALGTIVALGIALYIFVRYWLQER